MDKEKIIEGFENYRESLHSESQFLYSLLHVSKTLKQSEYAKGTNRYPAFFYITSFSIFSTIIIWTEKLFDKNSQVGWEKFLNFISSNIKTIYPKPYVSSGGEEWPISLSDIAKNKKQLSLVQESDLFSKINNLRDKYFAHFDKKYFFYKTDLFSENEITFDELFGLVSVWDELLMKYSIAYDGSEYALKPTNINDVEGLLKFIVRQSQKAREDAIAKI